MPIQTLETTHTVGEKVSIRDFLSLAPVIPVLTVDRIDDAMPLAEALVAGGLRVLEVTLRTPEALEAIRAMSEVEDAIVGAGTITCPEELEAVIEAGAKFAVSPGLTPDLGAAGADAPIPLLPGVMTPSEAMVALDHGFLTLKLFPASIAGGIPMLKALSGPLADLSFCPTGGISPETFRDYLALPNVLCVGGSWVAPRDAIKAQDWDRITDLARETTQ